MFGVRRFGCASATLIAHLAFAAAALAVDQPSTVIVTSNTSDARLTRALVLIRGELSAVGLDLQVRGPEETPAVPDTTNDRLSIDVKDGSIVVRVFAAGAQAPLVESVDLDGPEVSAEVIAVRAVEALRAARLLPAPAPHETTPKPAATRTPVEPPPAEHPPAEQPRPVASAPPVPLLQLELGPTFVQHLQGLPQPSAHFAVLAGPSWGFVELGAEGSLTRLDLQREPGSAQISRRALFLQLGGRVRVHHVWELRARGGIDYLHYSADGAAKPGYSSQNLEHDSAGVSLSLGGAYYFTRAVGVYLDLAGVVAFDAARVRLADESVVTLDQPSFAAGLGLLLGAF
ncbi:MAG TPA: hypothetical protein VER11_07915 [Polyangiaceae bacterium]|nr:hypothetical protein [Polyangiaceae bacterium]